MSEASENSPLLANEPQLEGSSSSSSAESTTFPATHYFKRPVKTLTKTATILAPIELILIIATQILSEAAPFSKYEWAVILTAIAVLTVASFVFALINLRFAFPIGLNILADFVLGLCLVDSVAALLANGIYDDSLCRHYYYPGPPMRGQPMELPVELPASPSCLRIALALHILMGICVSLGVFLALIHIIFLVLRFVACCKARVWKRPIGLYFPNGEISLSITVKVLNQEPAVAQSSASELAV